MSEIRLLLGSSHDQLMELAARLEVPGELVHLAAVLALGGLTDEQIRDQLEHLRQGIVNDGRALTVVQESLAAIRALAARRPQAGHQLVGHTADCIIEGWGPDRATCTSEALSGLVEAFASVSDAPAPQVLPLATSEASPEDQLVSLLQDVIYTVDVLSVVPIRFHLTETDDGGLAGDMEVVPLDAVTPIGPAPKAVSYHELAMRRTGEGWRCHVLIDV